MAGNPPLALRLPYAEESLAEWVENLARGLPDVGGLADAVAQVAAWAVQTGSRRELTDFLTGSEEIVELLEDGGPAAIAGLVVAISKAGYDYMNGDLSEEEFEQRCGEAGIRGVMVWACGAIGQGVLPLPVAGGLVGAAMGYIAAAATVEGLKIVRAATLEAHAAAARLARVQEVAAEATELLRAYQEKVELILVEQADQFTRCLMPLVEQLERELTTGDDLAAVSTMNRFAEALAFELEWTTLVEFDAFMRDEDRIFEL